MRKTSPRLLGKPRVHFQYNNLGDQGQDRAMLGISADSRRVPSPGKMDLKEKKGLNWRHCPPLSQYAHCQRWAVPGSTGQYRAP